MNSSQAQVSHWERLQNNFDLKTIQKIAAALGVHYYALLDGISPDAALPGMMVASGRGSPPHVAEDGAEYADLYADPSPQPTVGPLNKPRPAPDKDGFNQFFGGTGMLTIGDVIQNIMINGTEEEQRRLRRAKSNFMKTALELCDNIDARRETDAQKKTAGGNPPGGI